MAYEKQNFVKDQVLEAEHLNHIEDGIATIETELENKQPKGNYLTEHQPIKTINGQSLIGEGDIELKTAEESTTGESNVLNGKTFICIGDSFVKGHTLSESKTWAYKLANRNGMTYHKHAVNGVSLAYKSGQSATALINSVDSFISGISATDYVIFLAGHNDANPDLNGGSAVPIGENTDTVNTTFKGALNLLIDKLYTAYPTAKLLFLTPFNRRKIEEPYVEAMKEICGIWCVPCFDNYHSGGICFHNGAQAAKYELNSTLHLNEAGQERVSYLYESLLVNELPISYSMGASAAEESESITVDSELSTTSENPVQNKVIAEEISVVEETLRTYISQLEELISAYESGSGTTVYSITYALTGVSSRSVLKSIVAGSAYTTELTADSGYVLDTVTVTMGGEDITNEVYGDGSISISSVTGDVVITAIATEDESGGGSFTSFASEEWKYFNSSSGTRVGCFPTLKVGDVVNFNDDALWNTYKYAIATGTKGINSDWIGGGYQTGAYTVATAGVHTVMVARQDNADISTDERTTIASCIGYVVD